jgi:hypothetical protein
LRFSRGDIEAGESDGWHRKKRGKQAQPQRRQVHTQTPQTQLTGESRRKAWS